MKSRGKDRSFCQSGVSGRTEGQAEEKAVLGKQGWQELPDARTGHRATALLWGTLPPIARFLGGGYCLPSSGTVACGSELLDHDKAT